jgi:hypothetical protein
MRYKWPLLNPFATLIIGLNKSFPALSRKINSIHTLTQPQLPTTPFTMRCNIAIALSVALLSSVSAAPFFRRGLDSLLGGLLPDGLLGGPSPGGHGDQNHCPTQQGALLNANVLSKIECTTRGGGGGGRRINSAQPSDKYSDAYSSSSADFATASHY